MPTKVGPKPRHNDSTPSSRKVVVKARSVTLFRYIHGASAFGFVYAYLLDCMRVLTTSRGPVAVDPAAAPRPPPSRLTHVGRSEPGIKIVVTDDDSSRSRRCQRVKCTLLK
eukprot:TRINITY_DN12302_c0_g1_i2.p3 TRINITY_DN12302_c0_g1~~TRINITY_DN12302_c0_g1_i2.p3  ORF type:complete len:111 (-),score=2.08 TRINITY_DN12302_c0_g1_i2:101-433(-)